MSACDVKSYDFLYDMDRSRKYRIKSWSLLPRDFRPATDNFCKIIVVIILRLEEW